MATLNQCAFIGRVTQAPEVRTMQSGSKVCKLRMAINDSYKKKSGEKVETTEWLNVSVFVPSTVLFCENFLSKGDLVYLQGAMRTSEYDKDGEKRYSTEIVVSQYEHKLQKLNYTPKENSAGFAEDDLGDEIPFN